ncbi:uncharacterized protein [Clytia hemisphaerica]|uniref:uncharacterized protein n=1 Tax=Clytia hemisphaerica TaxID=252671 RepID=UPI0034D3B019
MSQREDETTQQYYVRLHEQALKCEFTDKEKEIKQQIELSTNSSKLRKYSFQNPQKTLNELLTIAKTFETMKIHTEEIEKQAEDINKISKRKLASNSSNYREQASEKKSCYRCGGEFPHSTKCAALGKTCSACGKPVILQEFVDRVREGPNQRDGTYTKPLNVVDETDEHISSQSVVVEKNQGEPKVEENSEHFEHIFTTSNAKTEGKIQQQDFKTKVLIENTPIEILIDTGASINVLNESTFRKINNRMNNTLKLKDTKTKLKTYGNDSPDLKIIGEVNLLIESKKKFVNTKFYVIKTDHKNLLSGTTATTLQLITVNNIEKATTPENTQKPIPEHLKEKLYVNLFTASER